MAKRKKHRHLYGKKEFLFNFFSLIIVICIGLYFGYRSIYYYTKQNEANKGNKQNLEEIIINSNKLITKGDGFHRDSDGYYFKGNISNNYVMFSNRLFRIIRLNNDGSIKLVSNDNQSNFMWGDNASYQKSNLRLWLEKTDDKYSGVYYDTILNLENYLVKTTYTEDTLTEDKIKSSKDEYKDYITTITLKDYITAGGKNSYLNTGKLYYLLGHSSNDNSLYVEEDGSISEGDSLIGYGIRPVITLKKNTISLYGNGTVDNPYTIEEKDNNYINKMVKLGNDYYTVYKEEGNVLRLYKNDYIKGIKHEFSKRISEFSLKDYTNIGRYLNNEYIEALSYNNLLLDTTFYIGELGGEDSYNYKNIYNDEVVCKIGLLNIFDYYNGSSHDFYYMNTTIGDVEYVLNNKGLLEEVDIEEEKNIIPVISIDKKILKKGKGTSGDPYTVG